MKAILWGLVVVALVAGCWIAYNRSVSSRGFGDVTNRDGSPLQQERMDTGAVDLDGKPVTTVDRSDRSDRQPDMVAPGGATNQPPSVATVQNTAVAVPTAAAAPGAGAPPTTDTMSPAAPNGLAFAGAGKYQWYRQGNLTWRLNTESGSTCIAFATMEEWKKPLVVQHGCGAAA